jgi:hypothetical protein
MAIAHPLQATLIDRRPLGLRDIPDFAVGI